MNTTFIAMSRTLALRVGTGSWRTQTHQRAGVHDAGRGDDQRFMHRDAGYTTKIELGGADV